MPESISVLKLKNHWCLIFRKIILNWPCSPVGPGKPGGPGSPIDPGRPGFPVLPSLPIEPGRPFGPVWHNLGTIIICTVYGTQHLVVILLYWSRLLSWQIISSTWQLAPKESRWLHSTPSLGMKMPILEFLNSKGPLKNQKVSVLTWTSRNSRLTGHSRGTRASSFTRVTHVS